MKFCFSTAQCFFIFGECETDGFDPQRLAVRYAYVNKDFGRSECAWR